MLQALVLCSPVLLVGLLVGLVISLVQALTQIQEQSIAFVPKLLAMLFALCLTLPWLMGRMVEYAQSLFQDIPTSL